MSFEVLLVCYHTGNPSGVPRKRLHELFDAYVKDGSDPDWWDVEYGRIERCSIHLTPMTSDNDLIYVITVHRPCGDRRLWQSLFSLMTEENVILVIPGDERLLIAKESVTAHLPADLVESQGEPMVVADADEILECIQTS